VVCVHRALSAFCCPLPSASVFELHRRSRSCSTCRLKKLSLMFLFCSSGSFLDLPAPSRSQVYRCLRPHYPLPGFALLPPLFFPSDEFVFVPCHWEIKAVDSGCGWTGHGSCRFPPFVFPCFFFSGICSKRWPYERVSRMLTFFVFLLYCDRLTVHLQGVDF